jgi:thiosulfate dehydrogenase [quinone] large subunit
LSTAAARTATADRTPAAPGGSALDRRLMALIAPVVRITLAVVWFQGASWKAPPDFAALGNFTRFAVSEPVFAPWAFFVDSVVLPNLAVFGWSVLLVESLLAAFLVLGLFTRLFALVGAGQTTAIALSALNAPNEWIWSYLLMILAHLAVFAMAAGRSGGLDGVLRPIWARKDTALARIFLRAS